MSRSHYILLVMALLCGLIGTFCFVYEAEAQMQESGKQTLAKAVPVSYASLWTSADPEVAENVCFMYTHAAKKYNWFSEVTLIVWGPSANLLANNSSLQTKVQAMIADGVIVQACRACADIYGVTQILENLGIEVKYMGSPMSQMIKDGVKFLTF